jgi:hypothetical protein
MASERVVPISPEVAEQLEQARLTSAFDALYEAGGAGACLRIITILTERLAQRLRAEAARILAGQTGGGA